MFQLTYISTAHPGGALAQVDAILAASRRNNRRCGITGLLVFDGVRYLQALEGEREAVLRTYARIRADPRHRATVILSERDAGGGEFGSWAMACERVAAASATGGLVDTVDAMVSGISDKNLRALFSSFVRLDRSAA